MPEKDMTTEKILPYTMTTQHQQLQHRWRQQRQQKTLADLPDDVLLLIFADLDSARDLRALALQCRSLARLVREDGWRVFVRNRFPSLAVPHPSGQSPPRPPPPAGSAASETVNGQDQAQKSSVTASPRASWAQLAHSLAFQSRCWDKRALQFHGLLGNFARQGRNQGNRPQRAQREGGMFQPVLDSYLDPHTGEEVMVCGAGEDLVARYRRGGRRGDDKPLEVVSVRADGKDRGLHAGYDDIRAIKLVKEQRMWDGSRVVVTGRDNGELALLSAEPERFGKMLVRLLPSDANGIGASPSHGLSIGPGSRRGAKQEPIRSVDVVRSGEGSLIAATNNSSVLVYDVPRDEATEAAPLAVYNLLTEQLGGGGAPLQRPHLCSAVWMGQDSLLAVTVKGSSDPLRYVSITPTSWTHSAAAKNRDIEKMFGIEYKNICPNSLQPIHRVAGAKGGTDLLLSAWRDGSCRQVRTPTSFTHG